MGDIFGSKNASGNNLPAMYIDCLPVMHRGVKSTADVIKQQNGFDSYYFHINPGIYFPTEKEMKNSCLREK